MTQNSDFMLLKRTPSKSFDTGSPLETSPKRLPVRFRLFIHQGLQDKVKLSRHQCRNVVRTDQKTITWNVQRGEGGTGKDSGKYSSVQLQKSELVMLSWRKTMRTVTWQAVHNNCPYLGILLSEDLKWGTHISNTSKKSNSTLGFIQKKPLPPSLPLQTKCISNTSPSSHWMRLNRPGLCQPQEGNRQPREDPEKRGKIHC